MFYFFSIRFCLRKFGDQFLAVLNTKFQNGAVDVHTGILVESIKSFFSQRILDPKNPFPVYRKLLNGRRNPVTVSFRLCNRFRIKEPQVNVPELIIDQDMKTVKPDTLPLIIYFFFRFIPEWMKHIQNKRSLTPYPRVSIFRKSCSPTVRKVGEFFEASRVYGFR